MIPQFFLRMLGFLFGHWVSTSYSKGWKDTFGHTRCRESPYYSDDQPVTILYQKNTISGQRRKRIVDGHMTKTEIAIEFEEFLKQINPQKKNEDLELRELDLKLAKTLKEKDNELY